MGRLQSRYALRIYEIALSYKSLAGKDGNAENARYMERTLEELRKIFERSTGSAERWREKELEHLKELYPAEFAELYAAAFISLKPLPGNVGENMRKFAAEGQALEKIKERRGVVK
jgi:hypothetical protein